MSEIKAHSVFVPAKQLPREGIPDVERFEKMTGIKKTRRWEDIMLPMRSAMERFKAHVVPEKIGAVIVVTQSPIMFSPCFAAAVHKTFGLDSRIPVIDVNQSCDGFVYGLWLARCIHPRPPMSQVLLLCYDQLRFNPNPTEGLIFSDAISLTVLEPLAGTPVWFFTDGAGGEHLGMTRHGAMWMDGGKVFDFVRAKVPDRLKEFDAQYGPFDFLCQHQANKAMMQLVDKKSGFQDRSLYAIEEFGNQSLVGIPTTLACHEERILGKHVLLAGYGAGWCAAITMVEWPETKVSSIQELA